METVSLWGGGGVGGGGRWLVGWCEEREEEEEEVFFFFPSKKSVCRLLLIPASLSEMIREIILIILNAITVSAAPLPPLSRCRIKSMCHSM